MNEVNVKHCAQVARAGIAACTLAGSLLLALATGERAAAASPSTGGARTAAVGGARPAAHTSSIVHIADTGSPQTKSVSMKVSESGTGRNILILHGGGGPGTMAALAAHLAETAHVITPTHPGWDGTPRPESLATVAALADAYVRYLDDHDLKDVVVVGSSLGGWLGAEIALRDTAHRVTGLVIINGVGVNIPGQPITNISHFTPPEIAKVAYHDPSKFGAGAPPPTPERIAMMRANQATLAVFAGDPYCYDPTLIGRLKRTRNDFRLSSSAFTREKCDNRTLWRRMSMLSSLPRTGVAKCGERMYTSLQRPIAASCSSLVESSIWLPLTELRLAE